MYIRRKVFSSFIDENGEERYFSTTEFEDERLYSQIPGVGYVTPKEYKEWMDAQAKKHGFANNKEMNKYLNREGINNMILDDARANADKKALDDYNAKQVQRAEKRANQKTYEEVAKKEAAKKRAADKAAKQAARKEAYEKSLRGKTDKAAGWVKKAWNGEVGKLGKTGNRIAMVATPVVAAGATYGGIKGVQAIKNKRAALTDED